MKDKAHLLLSWFSFSVRKEPLVEMKDRIGKPWACIRDLGWVLVFYENFKMFKWKTKPPKACHESIGNNGFFSLNLNNNYKSFFLGCPAGAAIKNILHKFGFFSVYSYRMVSGLLPLENIKFQIRATDGKTWCLLKSKTIFLSCWFKTCNC